MSYDVGNTTSLQMGSSLVEGLESIVGLNKEQQNPDMNSLARRTLASTAVYWAPTFLPQVSSYFDFVNYASFQSRTVYSAWYNSFNTTAFALSSIYNLAKGDTLKAQNYFKASLKHGWRAAFDIGVRYYCPINLMYPSMAEGALHALIPSQMRKGLSFISSFIDNKLIGEEKPLREPLAPRVPILDGAPPQMLPPVNLHVASDTESEEDSHSVSGDSDRGSNVEFQSVAEDSDGDDSNAPLSVTDENSNPSSLPPGFQSDRERKYSSSHIRRPRTRRPLGPKQKAAPRRPRSSACSSSSSRPRSSLLNKPSSIDNVADARAKLEKANNEYADALRKQKREALLAKKAQRVLEQAQLLARNSSGREDQTERIAAAHAKVKERNEASGKAVRDLSYALLKQSKAKEALKLAKNQARIKAQRDSKKT